MDRPSEDDAARRDWMGLLTRAPGDALQKLWGDAGAPPQFSWLRPPETGAVMVRGRAGGVGAVFNLGEMTVTRASVALDCGAVGHAWVQGRDRRKAEIAALVDALMQTAAAPRLRAQVLAPLAEAERARRDARARKAAATQVAFFTMARGDA